MTTATAPLVLGPDAHVEYIGPNREQIDRTLTLLEGMLALMQTLAHPSVIVKTEGKR